MEEHETTGNVILVKVGCEACPSNSLTMLTRKELEEAESEVGKKRVCPKCQTAWRLDALDIRFKVTPDSPTVVTALPLWTPRLTKETPARQMHALPDAFDNYDEESVANAVEEYASELASRLASAPTEPKETIDIPANDAVPQR